ncbi:hypothetical protein BDV10DRAFT_180037 [Aspergillus recurvatus]
MKLASFLSVFGVAAFTMAQYDGPCGSARTCISNCPNADFFPIIDPCEIGDDGQPDCYVSFYCA